MFLTAYDSTVGRASAVAMFVGRSRTDGCIANRHFVWTSYESSHDQAQIEVKSIDRIGTYQASSEQLDGRFSRLPLVFEWLWSLGSLMDLLWSW